MSEKDEIKEYLQRKTNIEKDDAVGQTLINLTAGILSRRRDKFGGVVELIKDSNVLETEVIEEN